MSQFIDLTSALLRMADKRAIHRQGSDPDAVMEGLTSEVRFVEYLKKAASKWMDLTGSIADMRGIDFVAIIDGKVRAFDVKSSREGAESSEQKTVSVRLPRFEADYIPVETVYYDYPTRTWVSA